MPRAKVFQSIRRAAILFALFALAISLTACKTLEVMPDRAERVDMYMQAEKAQKALVPVVLSTEEYAQAQTFAEASVDLSLVFLELNAYFLDKAYASDEEVSAAVAEVMPRALKQIEHIRSLELPNSLSQWREMHYNPGLEFFENATKNYPEATRNVDYALIQECLLDIRDGGTLLDAAGQSLEEWVPDLDSLNNLDYLYRAQEEANMKRIQESR